jgi:ribosomal-protein-alanine N-acetyltransferase
MRAIHTPRLTLVPVHEENANLLWAVLQQPDLREFQDLPGVDLAQFRRMVARRPRHLVRGIAGRFEWLIVEGEQAAPCGWVSLRLHDREPRVGEVGYSVVAAQRGRGLATEALRAIVNEGFALARLASIRAYCIPENASSRAVLAKLGFEPDGMMSHGATIGGRAVNVLSFALDRSTVPSFIPILS